MKKYILINYMKFIMSICVVAIHIRPLEHINCKMAISLLNSFVLLAVPFFLMSSGFLFGKKINLENINSNNNLNMLNIKIVKMIRLYLTFTIIYFPITMYNFFVNGNSFIKNILLFVRGVFIVGENYNSWILWYILASIYCFILLKILFFKKIDIKKIVIIFVFIYLVGLIIDIILALNVKSVLINDLKNFFIMTIYSGRLLRSFIYIILGIIISNKNEKTNINIYCIRFILMFLISVFIYNTTIKSIVIIICSYDLFNIIINIKLKNTNEKISNELRYCSKIIYFFHLYIWTLYCLIINKNIKPIYGAKPFIICLITTMLIGHTVYKLKKEN